MRSEYRHGQSRERALPAGVAQLGQRQGNHITDQGFTGYGGLEILTGKPGLQSELGNKLALETVCGPGGSREIHRSGSQQPAGSNPGSPMPRGNPLAGWERK